MPEFCRRHHLSERDTSTGRMAGGKSPLDVDDCPAEKTRRTPKLSTTLPSAIPSQVHLDYLFVLTVADIAATNPNFGTPVRATLLTQLYLEALQSNPPGFDTPY